jgi:Carboxypeptidase regulatory-like domain
MNFTRIGLARIASVMLLLALTGIASPQSGKKDGESKERTVQGFVIDASGKPVPHAIVQLKNTRTQQIRSFIAQDKGDFFFNGLNPDVDYEVRAEADGNSSATRTLSSYDGRKQFIVTLKLNK